MKVYLLTFDGLSQERETLLLFLDRHPEIVDWHASMTNAVFIVSELEAAQLRDLLEDGPVSGFIVVEIHPEDYDKSVGGRLPRATWEFIQRKAIAS